MATRFYFHDATDTTTGLPTTEQSPKWTSSKNVEAQNINHVMNTTIGTGQVQLRLSSNPTTSWQYYYFTRFVSAALDMSSISSNTWTFNFAARESSLSANFPVGQGDDTTNVVCYVWRPGTGKVGTIRDDWTVNELTEGTSSNTEYSHNITFPGAAVSGMQAGDRLVFEVWFTTKQASPSSFNDDLFYDGTTATTSSNTVVSNHATFIETPQNLTFQAGATMPVGNTMSHLYNIEGTSSATLVGNSMMHRYRILPEQPSSSEQITADGFTIFMRIYIPFLNNEVLYNKNGVLFSKIDDEQVTHAYVAQITDNGDIYFIVKDNSREYVLSVPQAISIPFSGIPDYEETDFNSLDFFTAATIGTLPQPIPYHDLAFTYSFIDHKMQVLDNGILLASTAGYAEGNGLIGWWRLNEGGDIGNAIVNPTSFTKTVYNSIPTGNNGTITNATWSQITDRPHETYLDFLGGTGKYVFIPQYSTINSFTTGMTISLWYRPHSTPAQGLFHFLVVKNWAAFNSFIMYVDNPAGTPRITVAAKDASTTAFANFSDPFAAGLDQWYHIVMQWGGPGTTINTYVNGVKSTGSTLAGTIVSATNLVFGHSGTSAPGGMIHDVKIWNRGLSDIEVETLFEGGHPVSGFPIWQEDPPPPPDVPQPITNPFTQIYHLAKPTSNFTWQTLHKLFTSGFTQFSQVDDGIVVPENNQPFAPVYTVTGAGGGGGGGGTVETVYNVTTGSSPQHLEFEDGVSRAGIQFNSGNSHLNKRVTQVSVQFRKQGSPGGTVSVGIRRASGDSFVSLGSFSPGSFGSGEQTATINATSNSYAMQAGDVVSVEYPSGSNTIELTEIESGGGVSGFTSRVYDGGWGNNSRTLCMVIQTTSGAGGGGVGVSMFGSVVNSVGGATISKIHVNSTSASIYNKQITRVTLKLSKVGSPTGTLQVQLRSSNTNAQINMGNLNVATLNETPTDKIFTNTNNGLPTGFALPNGGGVAIVYSGGNPSNYVVVQASGSSEVSNVHVRNLEYNNQPFPFGGFIWKDYTSQDITGTLETGGFIVPAKNPWFALDGGAVKAVGQKPINASGALAGKKVTRFKPKLKAVGNPTGTIRCVIRTSAGTEVGHLSAIEANTVSPSSFQEYEFTNILQSRTLVAGDMVLIEYTGTPTNHIQVMIEWDETHGGQLGNDQAVTFNGSSYTAIPADMSGLMFTGGSATDPTSRERVGIRVRGTGATNSILHLKKLSKALIWLRKVGNPPGNVFFRIRRGTDDSTVANIGQIATSDITGEVQKEFTNTPVSVYAIQLNDRVLVEYPDGDDTNYIQVGITTTEQIDGTNSHLIKYDALWTNYDEILTNDLIMTAHAGGDTFTPTGDEIPPAPPPKYSHDLHIFAGGHPYDYYEDTSIVENWISTISPDIRFYRKILTLEELANIFNNRKDRSNLPFTQIAVVGFFSLPP